MRNCPFFCLRPVVLNDEWRLPFEACPGNNCRKRICIFRSSYNFPLSLYLFYSALTPSHGLVFFKRNTSRNVCVCAEKSRPTARHTREDHKNGPNELPYQGTAIKARESGNQGVRQSGNRVESHGLSRALRQYLLICI